MLFKGHKVSPKGEWWQIAIIHQKETISETEGSTKHKWQKDPLGKFLVKCFWGPKFRHLLQEHAAFLTSWLSVVHKPHRCLNSVIAKWMNDCLLHPALNLSLRISEPLLAKSKAVHQTMSANEPKGELVSL